MNKLLYILLIIISSKFLGQTKKYDTLFIASKKYLLEVSHNYKCGPYDFPFNIAESRYKYLHSNFKYESIDISNCHQQKEFNANGLEIIELKCDKYDFKTYSLDNLLDSLNVDITKMFASQILIKTETGKYHIEKIQFKIVYDSTITTINPEIRTPIDNISENFYWHISEVLHKKTPRFIILNNMLYYDKKRTLQYIPRQFIIKLK